MSDIDSSHGIAGGTAEIIDHLTPGAGPGYREHDGRDAGDIGMARDGVDLLFASIARRLCPEDALLAPDRDRLLWNAVEYLRSHVGRLEARLDNRLKPRQTEQGEDRNADADDDAGDEEFLKAEQAEATQRQIEVLRAALDHALMRYDEVMGRPWLVRHDSLDMQGSELGLGAQIDAEAFLEARGAWQPAEDTLTRVREAMEEQAEKRAKLRASALGREAPEPLAELVLSGSDTGENTAAALAGMFQALHLVYPDGTQLQDERAAGAWRLVRLFDSAAEHLSVDAMKRMPDHPALLGESEAEAVAAFDEGTRSLMRRIEMLARATDGAAALYRETTEEDWERRDPTMTAAGGPRTPAHAGLTGEHYAATHRAAALGHPSPLPLDGPHVVIAGGAELDPDASREAVEAALERLHERIPEMVLHYAARLQDRGGKTRRQGVDPIVRRWASARGIPLIPHPPRWDAENGRYDIHGRDDGWIAMKPELIVDFGGGNAHRRFLSLARQGGLDVRAIPSPARTQAQGIATVAAARPREEQASERRVLRWAGIGARKTPEAVQADMTALARQMADARFHLASGGAKGADAAFAVGTPVGQRTQWLPWEGYNKLQGPDCRTLSPERMRECLAIAEEHHAAWHRCSDGVKKMHARNVAILLGPELDRPVDVVLCWTPEGRVEGGTGMALRIAASRGIPVLNLGSMTVQAARERLRQLQQDSGLRREQGRSPEPMPDRSRDKAPTPGDERRQRRELRRERALTRIRGMLREFDITTLPRDALAELRDAGQSDRPGDERLHALSADQLVDGLDRLHGKIEQLRADMPAGGAAVPEGRETAMRIAAMEEAADRFHAVLADKTLADMREEDTRDIRDGGPSLNTQDRKFAADTQKQVLAVMLSVWRLAREGPLAMESNRLVSKAAGAFAAQHRWVDDILAAETRERSGLGLDHAPGSPEETAALARGAADSGEAGEAYEYMRTAAEQQQKDDGYLALAIRARRLDLMARTASTFSEAVRIDMRREYRERDRMRTQHLDGAETPDAVRGREQELRAAHRQLIHSAFANLETLCPVDHVSGEDRDRLLSRFAGVFRELARELEASVRRTVSKGKNADGFQRRQAAANYMRELVGHAEGELAGKTDRQAHVWTPRKTENAGEWLMERLSRARDRRRAESLAPQGRHLAIVGGRSLGEEHGQRIAQLLNHERARAPGTPLVLHCIEQEGAGLHAAKWAAMHGVACVTHRPKRYSASQLRKRDNLLLGVPPDILWNFGADPDRDRAAHMLVENARKAEHPIEIHDMESEPDSLIVSETVIDPPLAVNREFKRIFAAWQEADQAGDDGALIYRPGIEELRPDIDRILATPHLTGDERNFLTNFKGALDSESRVRDEIDSAIQRGRKHLAQYEALIERRGPHTEGTVLFDTDPDYRKWELHARQITRTFENWFAIDDEHRDHIDRRRLDLTDIAAELRAIRRTARSGELPPHRVEIPLENEPGPVDQRLDPKRHVDLMERALLPEDERDAQAVAELARWSRAWPKESLNLFRIYVDDAAQAGQKVSTHRLAYGLPPALAAGMAHISQEIWAREAVAIGQRQQMRERGMGLSA